MLAITNTCFIYNALYIYTHIYINFYRYSEGEASIMCKNYFPICPSESTESNGINKAEVLKCQKGSAQKDCHKTAIPGFQHCASHTCVHTQSRRNSIITSHDFGKSEILSPESPDLISLYLRVSEKFQKRGENERNKRHLTKTKA